MIEMADKFSKEKRSEIMSKIHRNDTTPELKVRHYLHTHGYGYRKNYGKLPGSPDIYLQKYNTAIFINGCFWHGHQNCKYYSLPKSNVEFWNKKISRNRKRDYNNILKLKELGIEPITLWECDIKHKFESTMNKLEIQIQSNQYKESLPMEFNYDPSSPQSILTYSKQIENKTLRQILHAPPNIYHTKNKGALGHAIEKDFFGYNINSKKEADFNKANMELKVIPIKEIKKNKNSPQLIKQMGMSVKERVILSIINYTDILHETWDTTELHHKLDRLLMMFYMHDKNVNIYDLKFLLSTIWEPFEADLPYLKKDWEMIYEKIASGKAHELSEGDTLLLGACTKGANKKSLIKQPNGPELAMQRAYSLKRSYVDYIFNIFYSDSFAEKALVVPMDTYEKILIEFNKIKYASLQDLFRMYNIRINRDAKQFLYMVTSELFKSLMGITADEFNKNNISEIEIKTILLKRNNIPKENMSFEQIKFDEIIEEEDWMHSEFRSKFENKKLLWIIFKTDVAYTKQRELELKDIRFIDIFYWNMPNNDLDTDVKYLWLDTVEKIKNNDFAHFKKMSETRVAHVRPKAINQNDVQVLKSGFVAPKKSFWLNKKYVAEQIRIELSQNGNRYY